MEPLSIPEMTSRLSARLAFRRIVMRSILPDMFADLKASLDTIRREEAKEMQAQLHEASLGDSGRGSGLTHAVSGADSSHGAVGWIQQQHAAHILRSRRQPILTGVTTVRLEATAMLNYVLVQDSCNMNSQSLPAMLEPLSMSCNCSSRPSYLAWLRFEGETHRTMLSAMIKLRAGFLSHDAQDLVLYKVSKSSAWTLGPL